MIIDFCKKREELERKKNLIMNCLINFYKDLNDSSGVNIPYFIEAKKTFNQIIKNNKDIDYYYNKIKENTQNVYCY